jgi:hypothetical protein
MIGEGSLASTLLGGVICTRDAWAIFISATDACDKVIFEGTDCFFSCILLVYVGWDELVLGSRLLADCWRLDDGLVG